MGRQRDGIENCIDCDRPIDTFAGVRCQRCRDKVWDASEAENDARDRAIESGIAREEGGEA